MVDYVHIFVLHHVHKYFAIMLTTSISDFRKDIKSYFDKVTQNFETLIINRGKDNGVVIMSLAEYNSLCATQYELSSNIQTAGDYISKKTFNLRSMTNDNHQFQDPILDSTATRNSAFNPSNVSRFINKFLSK